MWTKGCVFLTGVCLFLIPVSLCSAQGVGGWDQLWDLILLFVMGGLLHVIGFVLNERADVEVDRASKDLGNKPLVSGQVSEREALCISIVAALAIFIPLAFVTLDVLAFSLLGGSVLMAIVYDLWGKRAPLDVVLAGSITFILAAGAVATGEFDTGSLRHWTILGCLGGLQFLQTLFQNAIEGGIKDADHDAAAGARTFAAVLGVRIEEGYLIPGRTFVASGYFMKSVQLALLVYTAIFVIDFSTKLETLVVLSMLLFFVAIMLFSLGRFMGRKRFDRSSLKRTFSLHEMATFGAIMTVFIPLIGPVPFVILIVLPIAWFVTSNALLHAGALEPGV